MLLDHISDSGIFSVENMPYKKKTGVRYSLRAEMFGELFEKTNCFVPQ